MPRIAVISDVHGNLQALQEVLKKLETENPDHWLCLGDTVGYGPNPEECISLIREREIPSVLGNHDAGIVGKIDLKHFRDPNRTLIERSRQLVSSSNKDWLNNLPLIHREPGIYIAAHASPEKPEEWKYLDSAFKIRSLLEEIDYPFCFVGHTHKPALVADKLGIISLQKGRKYLINPGSVGQSRDDDQRASCCILDTEKMEYKNIRVEYDIQKVFVQLLKLGFSENESSHLLRLKK